MQDAITIKNLLGLTQEEAAMLFGITASQWSMFKSGKRGLPLPAQQQFGTLLQALKKDTNSKEIEQLLKEERVKAKEKLKRDFQKVQIKLLRTEKEIGILENHRLECLAALKVATILSEQKEGSISSDLIAIIKTRAIRTLNRHNLHKLEQLYLQKEMCEMLKLKIEKKLNM